MQKHPFISRNTLLKYVGDVCLVVCAYYLAFFLRFDGHILPRYWEIFVNSLPLMMLTKIVLFRSYHLYEFSWRYTGFHELKELLKGNTLALLIIATAYAATAGLVAYPRSVFFLDWLLSLIFLGVARVLPRMVREHRLFDVTLSKEKRRARQSAQKNVVLYGAGDLGFTIARQIQQSYQGRRNIIGFVDDRPSRRGLRIAGVEVLGDRSILPELANLNRIDELIVTISSISGEQLKKIFELCQQYCPSVRVAPGLDELFMGKVKISDLREVQIEDLLGREKVSLNEEKLRTFIQGKRVLVTGAGGSIGSELCFQLLKFAPEELVLLGRGENSIYKVKNRLLPHIEAERLKEVIGDIISYPKLDRIFDRFRPQIVFHAAAHKHVPLMELNPDEAVFNNIIGTQNVLRAADKYGVEKVVCISSDKAVNPSSVMGCCKRVAELLVQNYQSVGTVACAVRFGNVLGSRGSVVPLFKQQIENGGPVTITHPEIKRYFMTIPEAVLLVLQAGAVSGGGEIFLLEMGEPVRIADLARQMIRLSGQSEEKIPIRCVGLRPGEKLEEELSFADEEMEQTLIPKLYRVKGKQARRISYEAQVEELTGMAREMDFKGIQDVLRVLVPQYSPQTRYEETPQQRLVVAKKTG